MKFNRTSRHSSGSEKDLTSTIIIIIGNIDVPVTYILKHDPHFHWLVSSGVILCRSRKYPYLLHRGSCKFRGVDVTQFCCLKVHSLFHLFILGMQTGSPFTHGQKPEDWGRSPAPIPQLLTARHSRPRPFTTPVFLPVLVQLQLMS